MVSVATPLPVRWQQGSGPPVRRHRANADQPRARGGRLGLPCSSIFPNASFSCSVLRTGKQKGTIGMTPERRIDCAFNLRTLVTQSRPGKRPQARWLAGLQGIIIGVLRKTFSPIVELVSKVSRQGNAAFQGPWGTYRARPPFWPRQPVMAPPPSPIAPGAGHCSDSRWPTISSNRCRNVPSCFDLKARLVRSSTAMASCKAWTSSA